jgi:hypothetical protein
MKAYVVLEPTHVADVLREAPTLRKAVYQLGTSETRAAQGCLSAGHERNAATGVLSGAGLDQVASRMRPAGAGEGQSFAFAVVHQRHSDTARSQRLSRK